MAGIMPEKLTPEEIRTLKHMAKHYRVATSRFFIKGGMKDIAYQVCEKYELTLENLKSKERTRDHVIARIEFTKRCMKELNKSFSAIGRFLNKDHATVLYYKNKKYGE
tara:strand:+ start:575 stop:898 length:324 start_codon:yes stop_codon:yes gene_type:complete